MPREESPLRGVHVALLAAAAALLSHASYIDLGFLWLDRIDIQDGHALVPLTDPLRAFTRPYAATGFYRPLMALSISLDHAISWDPWLFHAVNVLLHAGVAALVPWFARVFFALSRPASLVVGLVFAVHPLSWLPVGAISYRSEILAGGLSLAAVACWIRAVRGVGPPALAAVLFAGALFSKESALWWVVALCALAGFAQSLPRERSLRVTASALVPPVAVWLVARGLFVGSGWAVAHRELSLLDHLRVRLAAVGLRGRDLLGDALPPLGDAVSPDETGWILLGALGVAAGVAGLVLCRRSPAARALAFIAVAAAPALQLLPAPRFAAPHYWYLAPVGVGVLAALLLGRRASPRRVVVLAAWLVLMTLVTLRGGARFANDEALFAPAVERRAGFCEGWQALGLAAWAREDPDPDLARRRFERALACSRRSIGYFDEPMARFNLAAIAGTQGRWTDVVSQLDAIAGREPPGLAAAAARMRHFAERELER